MNALESICSLRRSRLGVRVDAGCGARITEFCLDGRNALATARPETGSTFWPSPQQAWHWPPPEALDKKPYFVLTLADHPAGEASARHCLELASDVCPQTQLKIVKRFELEQDRLHVSYRMVNCADEVRSWAPWEISRITGGLSFYQSRAPVLASSSGVVAYASGCVWHQYTPELQLGANQKVFGNGSSGWLANLNNGLLLVKCFQPLAAGEFAPSEAEVEIYAHGDCERAYIELEQQGPYTPLAPEQELTWQVTWILSELPPEFNCEPGSRDLIEAVRTLLANRGLSALSSAD